MIDQRYYDMIPNLAQRQDSLTSQIADLLDVADRLGMYDATDWVRAAFEKDTRQARHPSKITR